MEEKQWQYQRAGRSVKDFLEISQTWLDIYESYKDTYSDKISNDINPKYLKGLLKVASLMYVPDDLIEDPVAKVILRAIKDAEKNDPNVLPTLYQSLTKARIEISKKIPV